MPDSARSGLDALTAREREVLRLFAQGLEGPEVARALNLSAKTVETHVRNARGKLGGIRRPAAARMVAEDERTTPAQPFPLPGAPPETSEEPPADATNRSPRAVSGIPFAALPPHPAGVDALGGDAEMVREDRAIFLHLPATAPDHRRTDGAENRGLSTLSKLLAIAALGFAVMAALALVAPVTDGLQRWADMIHRHRTN